MNEKTYELRQQRAKLLDANRELVERSEKENRSLTQDESTLFDSNEKAMRDLEKRISTLDRQAAADKIGLEDRDRRPGLLPHEDPNATKGRRYSIMKAIACMANKRPVDGLEGEVSQEIATRSQKSPQGFFMPLRMRGNLSDREREQRDLTTTTGVGSIPTILSKDWIELLRNAMRVKQAGAREILDITGKFAIPRQSGKATAYWVAESGAPTGSNQTLDQVLFTPHTIGAFTDISRRFFELTVLEDGEQFVTEDLTAIIARGVDLAALNGSGLSNQPLGILQNTAITGPNTVALGTVGGAPTWAAMVNLYTIVARGNAADLGPFTYLGNADVTGTLATTPKIGTTYPVFLLEDDKVYGKPYLETNQLPNNLTKSTGTNLSAMVGGIFNQLILAFWSGIDILVDPYTGSSSGTVRVVALQDMDVQPRHPEAFAVIVDFLDNQA